MVIDCKKLQFAQCQQFFLEVAIHIEPFKIYKYLELTFIVIYWRRCICLLLYIEKEK